MPASLILPAFFTAAEISAGGLAVAASTLAIRVATTIAIASLLNRDVQQPTGGGNTGGTIQLPPATDNKLPVVYGTVWVSPVITDVKLSTDQQTMWYVLAFSETTDGGTINFGQVWWDDKILIFDPSNPSEIRGWYRPNDNTTVTGVAGKISMWFYNNGSNSLLTTHHCIAENGSSTEGTTTLSAISVLQDSGIDVTQQWTGNDLMTNTVFAVVRIKYDSDHGVTGLGQIKAQVVNSLNQPGDVLRDYLVNDRYGCAVPYTNLDDDKFNLLNTYSGQTHQLQNTQGGYDSGVRYQINGIVDTNRDCLSNLVQIADNADSWIQWNEAQGLWGVLINRGIDETPGLSTSSMTVITSDQIIGGIQVNPLDLNSTYNGVKITFPNAFLVDANNTPVIDTAKGQSDYRYYVLDPIQKFINEPINELSLMLPFTTNSLQATYIGYKRVWNSREDIIITFTMDYSGIQIDAGDIIAIKHEWYGWDAKAYGGKVFPGKPFRVTQVREVKESDGFLSVQITASSYNDQVYTATNPHYYSRASFSGITDPGYISKPDAPIVTNVNTASSSFTVQGAIPVQGNVEAMEFWYSVTTSTNINNNYSLYTTQYYSNGSLYPHQDTNGNTYVEQTTVSFLPAGTYWWRTRGVGVDTRSEFSDASTAFTWAGGTAGPVNGTQILDNTIPGSKVISGDPATQGTSQSTGFFDTLGKVAVGGLALASAWSLSKKFGFDPGKLFNGDGAGNDGGEQQPVPDLYPKQPNYADTLPIYKVGDSITLVGDSTPPIGSINNYANFDGYDVPPFDNDGIAVASLDGLSSVDFGADSAQFVKV